MNRRKFLRWWFIGEPRKRKAQPTVVIIGGVPVEEKVKQDFLRLFSVWSSGWFWRITLTLFLAGKAFNLMGIPAKVVAYPVVIVWILAYGIQLVAPRR